MGCFEKHNAKNILYKGFIPEWSELFGKDDVSAYDAIRDILNTIIDIRDSIELDMPKNRCISYPESIKVKHVLQIHSEIISGKSHGPVFFSDPQSRSASRSNCGVGFTGSSYEYRIPEKSSASIISKDKANSRVINFLNKNIQSIADRLGKCVGITVYKNKKVTMEFTRNNCEHFTPSPICFTVEEGEFLSTISQEDANRKAFEYINSYGQKYANLHSSCPEYFESRMFSGYFRKSCGEELLSEEVYFYLPPGHFVSDVSQLDADTKARKAFNELGAIEAEEKGECKPVFYNDEIYDYYSFSGCPDGYRGVSRLVTVPEGISYSFISKEDANKKARVILDEEGYNLVNTEQECVVYEHRLTVTVNNERLADIFGDGLYPDGSTATVTVVPLEGYGIEKVLVDGDRFEVSGNSFDIKMNKRTFVKVYMSGLSFVDITPESSDLTKGSAHGGGSIKVGKKCSLLAKPESGYVFKHWVRDGDIVSTSAAYTFLVDINNAGVYTAIFE